MGRANHREVRLQASDVALAARWISNVALPSLEGRQDTILTPEFGAEYAARLVRLFVTLEKKAARKRIADEFIAAICIEEAASFAYAVGLCRPHWPLCEAAAILRIAHAMQEAGTVKRRGRKALTREEIEARAVGIVSSEERHQKRLKARVRRNEAWDAWSREMQRRGETILTTPMTSPKI